MEKRNNNILIPVDFSEQSLIAVEQSYNIAKMAEAEINLLHVIIESNSFWSMFSGSEKSDMEERIIKKLNDLANTIAEKSGLKVNVIIEKGKLVETILDVSERLKTQFIIAGTKSTQDFVERIVGSNALRLIRESKCPVITIKGKLHGEGCKNIVLPIDITKETKQKVSYAIYFAKYFGSTIHVITTSSSNDNYFVSRLKQQLSQVKTHIEKEGISCVTSFMFTESGNTEMADAIINYSKSVNADIIMIMTQQEIEVIKFFIGTLAKEVIHKSDIPVMSIVPKKVN